MGDGGISHSYNKTEHSNWKKCIVIAQNIENYKTEFDNVNSVIQLVSFH